MNVLEDTLKEVKEQIAEFRTHYLSNEQAVRAQLIEPILISLGWKTSNPKFVRHNAPNDEGKIPDYTLLKGSKNILIVEAKNLSIDLTDQKVINQISNYCYNQGVDFGILTNGVRWLLFNTFQKNPQDRIVWQIDIEKESIETVSRKLSSFSYENIDELETLIQTSKELEKNWNALVNSTDSITDIVTQRLIEKIKSLNPNFKIDQSKIRTFTESKLSELFEIAAIEEDEEKIVKKPELKINETEFSEVENNVFKLNRRSKPREKISVVFPDGTKFNDSKPTDTFVKTIQKIGVEKIKELNIVRSIPIVSETKHEFYNQHKLGKYWIMVTLSTIDKFKVLLEIESRLNLKLKLEKYLPKN